MVAALHHLSEGNSVEGEYPVMTRQVHVVQHSACLEHQRHTLDFAGVEHLVDLLAEQLDSGALLVPDTCLLQMWHKLRMNAKNINANTTRIRRKQSD